MANQHAGELLQKDFVGNAAFAADELEERFLRAAFDSDTPAFLPFIKLVRGHEGGLTEQIL
jgi:hypothetical protein